MALALPIPSRAQAAMEGARQDVLLGAGAFGKVRSVGGRAVKVCERFRDAAGEGLAALRRLRHPNLVRVNLVRAEGPKGSPRAVVEMQLLSGTELFELAGRLSASALLRVTRGLLAAVAHLHGQRLVHRDVKPENVLVQRGEAVLVDLGSMRPSGVRVPVQGTRAYLAPEARRRRWHRVRGALDDWSVLATLAAVAFGEAPPASRGELEVRVASSPRDTPRALLCGLAGMLEEAPEARLSAAAARRRLEHLLN